MVNTGVCVLPDNSAHHWGDDKRHCNVPARMPVFLLHNLPQITVTAVKRALIPREQSTETFNVIPMVRHLWQRWELVQIQHPAQVPVITFFGNLHLLRV
jgi:hypothetical protein